MPIITITEYKFPNGERVNAYITVKDRKAFEAWEKLTLRGYSIGFENNGHIVYADVVRDSDDCMIANTLFSVATITTGVGFSEKISEMLITALGIHEEGIYD